MNYNLFILFSKHYTTNEPLPKEIIETLNRSKLLYIKLLKEYVMEEDNISLEELCEKHNVRSRNFRVFLKRLSDIYEKINKH